MKIGEKAEHAAARYLHKRGLQLIVQNYYCRFGEIDLILQDGETLVFVEVRLRNSKSFGGAAASIDVRKQRKLICTANHYLAKIGHTPPCRFDAILMKSAAVQTILPSGAGKFVTIPQPGEFKDTDIEWIKNAFEA